MHRRHLVYSGNGGHEGVGGVRGGSGNGNDSEGFGGVWGDRSDGNGRQGKKPVSGGADSGGKGDSGWRTQVRAVNDSEGSRMARFGLSVAARGGSVRGFSFGLSAAARAAAWGALVFEGCRRRWEQRRHEQRRTTGAREVIGRVGVRVGGFWFLDN